METQQYRKKPVVIEARRLDDDDWTAIAEWCGGRITQTMPCSLLIDTLEGSMHVDEGDWIIKGVAGEFYPCKDAIFQQTYSLASESPIDVAGAMRAAGWTEKQIGAAMDARDAG